MSQCQVCTAPTDGFICAHHGAKLEKVLAEMPALIDDLEITATKQDRINPGGKRGKGDDAPLPFNWSASDYLWSIINTLSTWARHLAESRGCPPPARSALLGWLLASVQSIRMDEAGGQIYDEVTYAYEQAQRIIDRPEPEIYAGPCDAPDVRVTFDGFGMVTTIGTCGADLYARLVDRAVKCRACGMEYDLAERKAELLTKIPDELAPTAAIANALTTLLSPVTPSMIRQMSFRKQIANRGTKEAPMYRVGDVMDVLAARERKLSERRGRLAS